MSDRYIIQKSGDVWVIVDTEAKTQIFDVTLVGSRDVLQTPDEGIAKICVNALNERKPDFDPQGEIVRLDLEVNDLRNEIRTFRRIGNFINL